MLKIKANGNSPEDKCALQTSSLMSYPELCFFFKVQTDHLPRGLDRMECFKTFIYVKLGMKRIYLLLIMQTDKL